MMLEANVEVSAPPLSDDVPSAFVHPRYTPLSLINQLNELGAKGWEMMSCDPMQVGKNGDLQHATTAGMGWSRHYFCCFKRAVES